MNARYGKLFRYSVSAIALAATPALAQDQAAGTPPTRMNTIETVVVTAEKRTEDSQNVPIALSAIGGDSLDKLGIRDVATLGTRVPSLRFAPGASGGENTITMRGMSNQNTTNGGDMPVSYSIDGIYMGRSTTLDPEMFDIERIEVLRGPQGTLYGRNSVGGTINIITSKPTDELSGHVDALVGDYNARIFRGWANVPLYSCGDCKILARIVGVSANHDAYQKNLSTAPTATHTADGQDYDMMRAHLLFQFNADIDLLLSASRGVSRAPVATKMQFWQYPTRYAGQTFYTNPREIEKDYAENYKNVAEALSATFNWDMGFATLTSITARQKNYQYQTNDSDGSNLPLALSQGWQVSTSQWSQEVRLASNSETDPLKWIAGLFYFRENSRMNYPFWETGVNSGLLPGPSFGFGTAFILNSANGAQTTSWAPFGQIDYDLGKTSAGIPLTITLGARYSHDKKKGWNELDFYLPDFAAFFPPDGLVLARRGTHSERYAQWTGKLGLSYKVTPDILLFGNLSRGYLAGGNLSGVTYDPQTMWAYEVGVKTQTFDNRVQLNVTAFHQDITNMQIFRQDILGSRIDNAGKARVRGLEAELVAIPIDGLRLNTELSLQDAKYKQYTTFDNRFSGTFDYVGLPVPLSNYAGNRLIHVPEWTLNFGAEYAITTEMGTFTPRADVFWSGDLYFQSANNKPFDRNPSYALVDLSLDFTNPTGAYTVTGFVRNVFDRDVVSNATTGSGTLAAGFGIDDYTYLPPRTIGVRFGANF